MCLATVKLGSDLGRNHGRALGRCCRANLYERPVRIAGPGFRGIGKSTRTTARTAAIGIFAPGGPAFCPRDMSVHPRISAVAAGSRQPTGGNWGEQSVGELRIQILTPTQCVMDRLAAFYHWRDRQGLDQAVLVASLHLVDRDEIECWSISEGHSVSHREFVTRLQATTIRE